MPTGNRAKFRGLFSFPKHFQEEKVNVCEEEGLRNVSVSQVIHGVSRALLGSVER